MATKTLASRDAAATAIQSRFRGSLSRQRSSSKAPCAPAALGAKAVASYSSSSSVENGAGSEVARELQKQAYAKLSEERAQEEELKRMRQLKRRATREEKEEEQRLRLERLAAAKQRQEEKMAALNDQELNERILEKASDEVLGKMDMIRKKLLAQAYGVQPKVFLNRLFRKWDNDGDCTLDRTEFASMLRAHLSPEESRTLFAFIDRDHTGSVCASELSSFLELEAFGEQSRRSITRAVPPTPRRRAQFVFETLASSAGNQSDASFCIGLLKQDFGGESAPGAGDAPPPPRQATSTQARRFAEGGILLLLWQLVTNHNRNFGAEEQRLRAMIDDIESATTPVADAESKRSIYELRAQLRMLEVAREQADAAPMEMQPWFGREVEESCLSHSTLSDKEKLELLGRATKGPRLHQIQRAEALALIVPLINEITKLLSSSASFSKTLATFDMPGKVSCARRLFEVAFRVVNADTSGQNASSTAATPPLKSHSGQDSLQDRIAAMQAAMARVAAEAEEGDNNDDEPSVNWVCDVPSASAVEDVSSPSTSSSECIDELEALLRIVYLHRHAAVDAGNADQRALSSRDQVANARTLAACLFFSSPAVQLQGVGGREKALRSVASQVVADFSVAELSQLSSHLSHDETTDSASSESEVEDDDEPNDVAALSPATKVKKLPPYVPAIARLLDNLPDQFSGVVLAAADRRIASLHAQAARLQKKRLERMDAVERRKARDKAAKLKLQMLEDDRLRRLRRERIRREKAGAKHKAMEEGLAKLQYEAMLREQALRKQKHELALKRQRKSGAAARKQRREELQKSNSLVGRRASGATDATMSPMSRSSSTSASQKSRLSPSLPSHYASHRDDEASTTEVPKRKSKLRKTKSPSKKKALDKYEALKLKYYKPKPKPKELWEQDLEAIIQDLPPLSSSDDEATEVRDTEPSRKSSKRKSKSAQPTALQRFIHGTSGMRPEFGSHTRNFDRRILNRFLPDLSIIDPSGGMVPPSPEFQTSSRATTSDDIFGGGSHGARDTRNEASQRSHSHSRSPSHRVRLSALEDSQTMSSEHDGISAQAGPHWAERELGLGVGAECEVLISDSDMVNVGLLPSLLDVEVVSGTTTATPKSEDAQAYQGETVMAEVAEAGSSDKEKLGIDRRKNASPIPENGDATKIVSPTYGQNRGQNWVEGVIIAVRPNGTVDLFLPSSVHKRYLKPMLLQQPRNRLRKRQK